MWKTYKYSGSNYHGVVQG